MAFERFLLEPIASCHHLKLCTLLASESEHVHLSYLSEQLVLQVLARQDATEPSHSPLHQSRGVGSDRPDA